MKKIYLSIAAVLVTALSFSQDHPLNQTGNNTTAANSTLSNFEAIRNGNAINIFWTALNESNMSSHVLERSANGSGFSSLGTIVAQNSATPFKYNFPDATPIEGINYYRLRTTDKRGMVTYSKILEVDNGFTKSNVRVIANPIQSGVMNVQLNNISSGKYFITLYNNGGQQVLARSLNFSEGSSTQTINLPRNLSRGSYFLQINNGVTRMNKQVLLQ